MLKQPNYPDRRICVDDECWTSSIQAKPWLTTRTWQLPGRVWFLQISLLKERLNVFRPASRMLRVWVTCLNWWCMFAILSQSSASIHYPVRQVTQTQSILLAGLDKLSLSFKNLRILARKQFLDAKLFCCWRSEEACALACDSPLWWCTRLVGAYWQVYRQSTRHLLTPSEMHLNT